MKKAVGQAMFKQKQKSSQPRGITQITIIMPQKNLNLIDLNPCSHPLS